MLREWRDNIWLVAGLVVVSLAIWFFGTSLFAILKNYFTPLGVDVEDVYVMKIGYHRPGSPDYVEAGDETQTMNDNDLRAILSRIRNNSCVEYAGFANNGAPYDASFIGNNVRNRFPHPDSIFYYGNTRRISPDVVKVLRLESATGKDEDYLRGKMAAGEILVSHVDGDKLGEEAASARLAEDLDREICNYDTTKVLYVADVIRKIRRNVYDDYYNCGDIIYSINEEGILTDYRGEDVREILVRVKPGLGKRFLEDFNNNPEMSMQRNVFLRSCEPLKNKGKAMERKNDVKVRIHIAIVAFMLLIIFLGLLGTFWFRTQQRVSEIAIRRVCGATKGSIFRRIMGEGMLLILISTILAGIIGWIAIKYLGYIGEYGMKTLVWAEVATAVAVAIGIVLSVSVPAWLAMRIDPALAVKDE